MARTPHVTFLSIIVNHRDQPELAPSNKHHELIDLVC
jgi:hypothetical protein